MRDDRIMSSLRQAVGAVEDELRTKANDALRPLSALAGPQEPGPGGVAVVRFQNGKAARFDHHRDGWWQAPTEAVTVPPAGCAERVSGRFGWEYIERQAKGEGRALELWPEAWPLETCGHIPARVMARAVETDRKRREVIAARCDCPDCGHPDAQHGLDGCTEHAWIDEVALCEPGRLRTWGPACGCPRVGSHLSMHPVLSANPVWRGPDYVHPQYLAEPLAGKPVTVHEPTDLDLCVLYGNVPVGPLGSLPDDPRVTYVTRESINWPERTAA